MDEAPPAGVPEPAVAIEAAEAPSPLVLVCDHASNHLPARYGSLGLTADDLLRHFAWDPGALAVSRRLSALLDAPLVFGCVSRLVLDVNRHPSDVDSIVETADGSPGARQFSVFRPASASVASPRSTHPTMRRSRICWRRARRRGRRSALVAIHTFAPSLQGVVRPWHCGVIFASDSRLGEALVEELAARGRARRWRQ